MKISSSLQENVEVIRRHVNGPKDEIISDEIKKMINNILTFATQFYDITELLSRYQYESIITTRRILETEISQLASKLCGLGRSMLDMRALISANKSVSEYYFTDKFSKANYKYIMKMKYAREDLLMNILMLINIRNKLECAIIDE